jgi:laccase
VESGKTYLLRIISAVMNEEMFFGIAGHSITVVGQDGAYIKPINTNYIMISPGQTMDVLLTANQTPSYYYMAATPFVDSNVPFDRSNTSAIIKYTGNYTAPSSPPYPSLPNVTDRAGADNFTSRIRSLASTEHPIEVPQEIDERIVITVSVNQLPCDQDSCAGRSGSRLAASLNNVSFSTPTTDILQAYYK